MTGARPLTAFVDPASVRERNGQCPSTDSITRLEDEHRFARGLDRVCRSEAGKSCSDDANIDRYPCAARSGGIVRRGNGATSIRGRIARGAHEARGGSHAGDFQELTSRYIGW